MSEIDEMAAWLRECADEDECFGGTSEEWLAKLRRAADLLECSDKRIAELEAQIVEMNTEAFHLKKQVDEVIPAIYRSFEEKSAAHEKVCAGTWVPVGERLPDVYRIDRLPVIVGGRRAAADWHDGDWHRLASEIDWPTHWLDARLPSTPSGNEDQRREG